MSLYSRSTVRSSRAGFTLPELMIVVVMCSAIMAATFVLYLQALRTWHRTSAEATAEERAAWAVEQMSWDLRGALRVDEATATKLTITMPLQDANHDNVITIQEGIPRLTGGDQVMFYMSDEAGSLAAQGDCLWKAVKRVGATEFAPHKKITQGVRSECNPTDPTTGQPSAMFIYWPDEWHTRGVLMTVTVVEKAGPRTYHRTEQAEAYLRNAT